MQVWAVVVRGPKVEEEEQTEEDCEDGDDALTMARHAAHKGRFCTAHGAARSCLVLSHVKRTSEGEQGTTKQRRVDRPELLD